MISLFSAQPTNKQNHSVHRGSKRGKCSCTSLRSNRRVSRIRHSSLYPSSSAHMYKHTHTHIHTHTHVSMYTHILLGLASPIQYIHTHTHTHTHVHTIVIMTHNDAHIRVHTRTHKKARRHTGVPASKDMRTHMRARARKHTLYTNKQGGRQPFPSRALSG